MAVAYGGIDGRIVCDGSVTVDRDYVHPRTAAGNSVRRHTAASIGPHDVEALRSPALLIDTL